MVAASQGKKVSIRNPQATRPWQHVLEPLSGYLQIGQKLLQEEVDYGDAWNFGPSEEGSTTVEEVVKNVKDHWNNFEYEFNKELNQPHEARLLKLDCTKANKLLSWHMVWDSKKTFEKTVKWYKSFYEKQKVLTNFHLQDYIEDAHSKGLSWTSN